MKNLGGSTLRVATVLILLAVGRVAISAPANRSRTTASFTIGTVTLSNFTKASGVLSKEVEIWGPGSTLVSYDAKLKSRLKLVAPHIIARREKPGVNEVSTAEATGGVQFSAEIPTADGKAMQELKGSADSLEYYRVTDKVVITGHVQTEITDPEHLIGPGRITGDTVTIDLKSRPYIFEVAGIPAHNMIQFVPKPPAAKPATTGTPPAQNANSGESQKSQPTIK